MKKLILVFVLTAFVGSMATTSFAAVNGVEFVKKNDDKKKKKKKKKAGCAAESKSCSSTPQKVPISRDFFLFQ
jgi:hypothetical protein